MLRRAALFLFTLTWLLGIPAQAVDAQSPTCGDFDTWIWAQSVLDTDPIGYRAGLDPDANGVACELLTMFGVAPAIWAPAVPSNTLPVTLVRVVDGDTIDVLFADQPDTIRLLGVDTPEAMTCGSASATSFLEYILSLAPDGVLHVETVDGLRDRYDRLLANVWFELSGEPYLVNDALLRGGWAKYVQGDLPERYVSPLQEAADFGHTHVLGVWFECGGFSKPAGSTPGSVLLQQARTHQPDQGQFPVVIEHSGDAAPAGGAPPASGTSGNQQSVATGECDPSYPDFCVAPVWLVGDLECDDVGGTWFTVLPPDPHGFDGDYDGYGCER